jgi:hypothetical protein
MQSAAVALLCGVGLGRPAAAKTDINVNADKTFSFAGLRTWAWHPEGAGDVKLAVTADSDPERVAARVDPLIVPAIEREMQARGYAKTDGQADLYVHYYVLATVGVSSQYMGQFVAPVPEWGLPPFAPATTALAIYPVGTLIIDLTSPARGAIIWRGSAQRRITIERPDEERRAVLDRAIRDLIKKIPQPRK